MRDEYAFAARNEAEVDVEKLVLELAPRRLLGLLVLELVV